MSSEKNIKHLHTCSNLLALYLLDQPENKKTKNELIKGAKKYLLMVNSIGSLISNEYSCGKTFANYSAVILGSSVIVLITGIKTNNCEFNSDLERLLNTMIYDLKCTFSDYSLEFYCKTNSKNTLNKLLKSGFEENEDINLLCRKMNKTTYFRIN